MKKPQSAVVEIFRVNGQLSYIDPWTREIKPVKNPVPNVMKNGDKLTVWRETSEY